MMADAPEFDPSKPFEAVGGSAPEFDPSKPFAPVAQQPLPATWGETALDVAKQIPSGIMAGLAGPSWLRRAGEAQLEVENLSGRPAPKAADYEKAAAQALPEPTSMPGRIARAATESLPLAIATGLPPTPASLAIQAASAAAQEGVGETVEKKFGPTAGAIAGTAAGIGTSLLPGAYHGLRTMLGRHMDYRGAPLLEDLNKSISDRYAGVRALGVEMEPTSVSRGLEEIKKSIDVSPDNAEKTFKFLNNAQKEHAPIPAKSTAEQLGLVEPGTKASVNFDKLESLRRDLNDVWQTAKFKGETDGPEARAAREAIRGLDNLLASGTLKTVTGDAQILAQAATKARAEAAAGFRLEAMDALRKRAENTAAAGTTNIERAYRTELKNFVRPNRKGISPAMKEGFNKAEIAELERASRIGSFPHVLRAIGIAGGYLGMAGGLGATAYTHDPRYLGFTALGMGARGLNGLMMRARGDRVQRMIGARSPLAQELGVGPSRITPEAGRNYMIYPLPGSIGAINSATGFKHGGRVTKSFRIKQ